MRASGRRGRLLKGLLERKVVMRILNCCTQFVTFKVPENLLIVVYVVNALRYLVDYTHAICILSLLHRQGLNSGMVAVA